MSLACEAGNGHRRLQGWERSSLIKRKSVRVALRGAAVLLLVQRLHVGDDRLRLLLCDAFGLKRRHAGLAALQDDLEQFVVRLARVELPLGLRPVTPRAFGLEDGGGI